MYQKLDALENLLNLMNILRCGIVVVDTGSMKT